MNCKISFQDDKVLLVFAAYMKRRQETDLVKQDAKVLIKMRTKKGMVYI